MTRKLKQSAKFSVIVALVVLMVMGMDQFFTENEAQIELGTFGELLEGVAAEVLTTPIQSDPNIGQSPTLRAELFVAQIAYLEAFEEVIQNNIL